MKNIEIRDLFEMRFMSQPRFSPDGAHTAYVSSVQSYDDNDYKSCIHLIDNATGKSRQHTHAGKERAFTWLDNRTLLFAAERGEADKPAEFAEKTCFYRLQIDGGEACKLFEIDKNVNTIIPLGAGKYAFTATVDLNAPAPDMDKTLRADEKDYHVLEEVPFWANGRGYVSRLRNTLYTFDAPRATSSAYRMSSSMCRALTATARAYSMPAPNTATGSRPTARRAYTTSILAPRRICCLRIRSAWAT